jgi:hypothetical protein
MARFKGVGDQLASDEKLEVAAMERWLMLALVSASLAAMPLLGCATSVRPGLSNAPRLGDAPATESRIADVVSNGDDACTGYTERGGVLRNRIPPCATRSAGYPLSVSEVPPPEGVTPGGALVRPWLDHFYVGWPCPTTSSSRQTKVWMTSTAAATPLATCSVP